MHRRSSNQSWPTWSKQSTVYRTAAHGQLRHRSHHECLARRRGFTGRDKIIKFQGCYHGHADSLLVSAGSGAATFGQPTVRASPELRQKNTITLPYNDTKAFNRLMDGFGNDIAAVIVEPVAGNMGCVPPVPGFLEALRSQTAAHGAILIFDEVMCGFRTDLHGAQAYYGITPDLTCLGKIIGGGLPAAAYGGKAYLMDCVSPAGPIYQAGTLSGNPWQSRPVWKRCASLRKIRTIRSALQPRRKSSATACARLRPQPAYRSASTSQAPCSASFSRPARSVILPWPMPAIRKPLLRISRPCWKPASTCRRLSSKRVSLR